MTQTYRQFGWVLGACFALIFGTLLPLIFHHPNPELFWITGIVIALIATVMPRMLRPVYSAWYRLGLVLKWVNTRIILSVVFFLMFVPVRIILLCLRRDAMRRVWDARVTSYREPVDDVPLDMEKPY